MDDGRDYQEEDAIMAAEGPTRDEEKAYEIELDVRDEERWAQEERAAGAQEDGADMEEGCFAEFVDGSYTNCGCPDCGEREEERRQHMFEAGHPHY